MFKVFFLFLLLLRSLTSIGQGKASIEVSLQSRYDKHADYITRFGYRSYTDGMKLWGRSQGLQFSYLHPLTKDIKLRVGAGYYLLKVDKIKRTSPWSDNVPNRTIDYNHPSGIQPVFHTNKYQYNNLSLAAGLIYEKAVAENLILQAGAAYNFLYTFSQKYRITYDNTMYKTTKPKELGFGLNASLGVLKIIRDKYYFNPELLVPVYQQLKGDQVFRESKKVKMTKWLQGGGLSISVGRYL